jgi:hypothetical protein
MNIPTRSLSCSLFALLCQLPCQADLFLNGDFASGQTSWVEVGGNGTFVFSYPESDGNPDAFGVIDHSAADGGFGLWVGNDGQPFTLDSLGLAAENTYNFTVDMKILSGPNIGGFKLDYTIGGENAGSTGDLRPAIIADGSTWETYTFPIAIPTGVDGFKVVPLWGVDSSVGYDNIGFDPVPLDQDPIPNNDFSSEVLAWSEIGDNTTWSYPATGGNPDEYGVMTNSGEGFGIWVANRNNILPLSKLGLEAGTRVNFQQDMILLSGNTIGGLKIEFYVGANMTGNTDNIPGTLIGDGTTWETYTFPVDIPGETNGIKIVPLWGAGSSVGYDNFRAETAPVPPTPLAAGVHPQFVEGTLVTWAPTNPDKVYQPQSSADGVAWTDFGPAYPGIETTTVLDPDSSAFYQVIEKDPAGDDALINGDLEIVSFTDPDCAEGWTCFTPTGQKPILTSSDSFSGTYSLRIAVLNNDSGAANQAEIQQNVGGAGGFVIGGETYNFSFRAKQISFGVSYVQRYRIQWFDDMSVPIAGTDVGFNDFTGGTGSWNLIEANDLVAPANAAGAFIQIFGATGGVAGSDARGEVLIDDLSLSLGGASEPVVLAATTEPGVGVFVTLESGKTYQAQTSDDLETFTDLSGPFVGTGQGTATGTPFEQPARFYRFKLIDEEAN